MSAMELQAMEKWIENPESCEVLVAYDDAGTRDAALRLCHSLSQKFSGEVEFSVSWYRFKYLREPQLAAQAAQAAARSDLILFSTQTDHEPTPEVKKWVELWVPMRTRGEGGLTALTHESRHPELRVSPLGEYLHDLARRTGLDFISPRSLLPNDAWENIRFREHEVTPVLNEILHRVHPVSHWGLNE